jgi:ABC-type spermidine/putrescine transport system permease subunit I
MVFPLYVTLERLDRTLSRLRRTSGPPLGDVPPGHAADHLPGLITGSILVFIPLMGEYVIPHDPGPRQDLPDRERAQLDFLSSRNWPRVGEGRRADRS